jgi:hypothetical protein
LRWLDTPHVPHGWECGVMMETSTRTLLCGDLFTQPGGGATPVTDADILGPSEAFRGQMDYYAHARRPRRRWRSSPASSRGCWRACTATRGKVTARRCSARSPIRSEPLFRDGHGPNLAGFRGGPSQRAQDAGGLPRRRFARSVQKLDR